MKKKIKIDEIVVVEGRDDVTTLSQVIDATIIPLHGNVGLSKKKIDFLKEISKNKEIILFTDPDYTGKKIREKINNNIGTNIINLYVSRSDATKNNNVGVENISKENIYNIFDEYIKNKNKRNLEDVKYKYDINFLLENNLMGNKNSVKRRELLGDILKIGYYNSKSLLNVLNGLNISYSELENAIKLVDKKLNKNEKVGVIFGKFIPPHKGHLNFIKYVSKEVDDLYVVLCVDKKRDDELVILSTLPKIITERDRYNFLKKETENLLNVKILILREEGITSYPNGWKEWTDRVINLFKINNIVINNVYTNESHDVINYEKYFLNNSVFSKDLSVNLIDPGRFEYNISATKIRNNYIRYKEFLPSSVYNFFEGKKLTK